MIPDKDLKSMDGVGVLTMEQLRTLYQAIKDNSIKPDVNYYPCPWCGKFYENEPCKKDHA